MAELFLRDVKFPVGVTPLVMNYPKFQNRKLLPYRVESAVNEEAFPVFLSALHGKDPSLTTENISNLLLLCEEFRFAGLLSMVSELQEWESVVDGEARRWIRDVEEQSLQQDRTVRFLQKEFVELQAACSKLERSRQL
jgi:hypothetical protein